MFTNFIYAVVVLNMITLSLYWYREPDAVEQTTGIVFAIFFIDALQWLFIGIYAAEAVMKLTFYGRDYFEYLWNIFDFVILIGMILFTAMAHSIHNDKLDLGMYLFQSAKLLILFKHVKMLKSMLQVIVLALPNIISFGVLLLIVVYLFAVIGVFLFAGIKLQKYLEEHANFQNIWTAFIQAFRMITLDGWIDVMHDMMRPNAQFFQCVDNPTYNDYVTNEHEPIGCGVIYSPIYCISLIVILPFIFVNLFIAIVAETVMEIHRLSHSVLNDERLNKFLQIWNKYDPGATGFIDYSIMWHILVELDEPLGASQIEMSGQYYSAITLWMMQLKVYYHNSTGNHCLEFYDVLEALVKRSLYRPQTLDKIYNNDSKELLVQGLEELWDQKAQLTMENPKYVENIEDLRYYTRAKEGKAKNPDYVLIKAKMSTVVWLILRINKKLKLKVKQRRKAELKRKEEAKIADGSPKVLTQQPPNKFPEMPPQTIPKPPSQIIPETSPQTITKPPPQISPESSPELLPRALQYYGHAESVVYEDSVKLEPKEEEKLSWSIRSELNSSNLSEHGGIQVKQTPRVFWKNNVGSAHAGAGLKSIKHTQPKRSKLLFRRTKK